MLCLKASRESICLVLAVNCPLLNAGRSTCTPGSGPGCSSTGTCLQWGRVETRGPFLGPWKKLTKVSFLPDFWLKV